MSGSDVDRYLLDVTAAHGTIWHRIPAGCCAVTSSARLTFGLCQVGCTRFEAFTTNDVRPYSHS